MKKSKFLSFLAAFALIFAACNNVGDEPDGPDSGNGNQEKTIPYSEAFEQTFGAFTTYDALGAQKWEISTQYKYAIMSGYINETQENIANEDWLISPKITLPAEKSIVLSFESVVRYTNGPDKAIFVMVSENYTGDVAAATWTQLPIEFKDASNWTLEEVQQDMSAYAGKTVTVAFKYVSTDVKAGTWELKNFKIEEGTVDVPPVIGDDEKGGINNPYTTAEVIEINPQSTTETEYKDVYVTGTIVGVYMTASKVILTENIPTDDVNATYNIIIGSVDEPVCVQLPSGDIRNNINVAENPGNIGKTIKVKGDILKYNTLPGVKNLESATIIE